MTWPERLLTRCFDQHIKHTPTGEPELYRWKILILHRLRLACYVHKFVQSDLTPPHPHVSKFLSIGLAGRYIEMRTINGQEVPVPYRAPWVRTWSTRVHRIHLPPGATCWTLVLAHVDLEANHARHAAQ